LTPAPSSLPGGQGTSYLTSTTILKLIPPTPAEEAEWTSQTLSLLSPSPHYTLPMPLLSSAGTYVYENWTATTYHPGTDNPTGHWPALFSAAQHFHKALEGVPEPPFLAQRKHPWAIGDRVAWSEDSPTRPITPPLVQLYTHLLTLRHDITTRPSQLVHGDLSGNVLFPPSVAAAPVIIDFSPFFRCVEYSIAIAVVDGIADFGVEEGEILGASGLLDAGKGGVEERRAFAVQMLIRALIFRVVARSELVPTMGEVRETEIKGFETVMGVIKKYI
ncbi:hypothetical protein V494_07975, partial [Pseudogymnoascus sp. VKM F-4513 (FW-928)]